MGSIKGLKSVIICVLILGLVLEQLQVEGKDCCPTTPQQVCFELCRLSAGLPQKFCNISCGCHCPSAFPHLHTHSDADTRNAIKFCNLGCRSSVCDNMNNVHRGEEKENDVELCDSACARFCNKIAISTSVAA